MFFACVRRVAPGALAATIAACGSSHGNASPNGAAPSGGGSSAESVTFDAMGVVTAAPSQSVDIAFHVSGADAAVSLWLDGDYADASLANGMIGTTNQAATVTLHAPSVASTFAIHARIGGGPDAVLPISVSASGFASVRVVASYAGKRPMPSLTASVFVHSTCADLAGAFAKGQLTDGGLAATGTLGAPIAIGSVPAGSHVAISVRVKQYAAGCVDVSSLSPDATGDEPVAILDRPMALGSAQLNTTLTFEPGTDDLAAWQKMLDAAIADAAGAFAGSNEAGALLDAMRAQIATSTAQSQYDASRSQGTWDTRTATWLSSKTPTMHDRITSWMVAAKPDMLGNLNAHIAGGAQNGYANFTLVSFAKLDATAAGFAASGPFALSADASDVLHVAGAIRAFPTALACAGGDARAVVQVPGSTDAANALASAIDCAGLTSSLVGSGTSYAGCDAACTATLCKSAISAMWSNAKGASAAEANGALPIAVSASAQAQVGDNAEPASFTGAWVGQVGTGGAMFGMRGQATGVEAPPMH
jgi:hypothetical protein